MSSITSSHKVRVKTTNSNKYLNITKSMTPKIEFKTNGWGDDRGCFVFRPETTDEKLKREQKEEKARIKKEEFIRKQKDDIIKKAESLGMKVIE